MSPHIVLQLEKIYAIVVKRMKKCALVRTEARASHLKSDHFSFDSSIMYTLSWSACIFKERKKTQRIIIKVKESSNDVALCNR